MPTGWQLRAARSLIGWQQQDLARHAGLHPGVLNRMEKAGKNRIGGMVRNIEAALDALEKHGVVIEPDCIRYTRKPRR